jgi:hypothetical protein
LVLEAALTNMDVVFDALVCAAEDVTDRRNARVSERGPLAA